MSVAPPLALVLGANGFIGAELTAQLLATGWQVRAVVRDPERLRRRFPGIEALACDLTQPEWRDASRWMELLDGVAAVVNLSGVLQPRDDAESWAVHCNAPAALFAACENAGVPRAIQISATGVEEAGTVYARSKRAGDAALMASGLDWTILRPALVVGDGSHGGTSLMRALAATPVALPVIGGVIEIETIHARDLARAIRACLTEGRGSREILYPAAEGRHSLEELLRAYRDWLGLSPPRVTLRVPISAGRVLARIGDALRLDPLNSTSLAQFEARMTGAPEPFAAAVGFAPSPLSDLLAQRPAHGQDLWHARLYLLRPVIRLVLAALWIVSGLLGLFSDPALYREMLAPVTQDAGVARGLAIGFGLFDLGLAAALLRGWRLKQIAAIQFLLVLGYTIGLTLLAPSLWLDPLGALLKNLPILALIAVHRVLEEDR